jgi:hypothetical protein
MRLIELEVGSWFRSPRWSENAVGELVEEVKAEHGLCRIHVHCRQPIPTRPSSMRSRLASVREMEAGDWEPCERPGWVTPQNCVGGSGGS